MKSNALRKASPRQQDFYTLEGWAVGVLLECHAVSECEFHGHRIDRGDPHAVARAREHAWSSSFRGARKRPWQQSMK
jgi:hypothetical protein